MIEMRIRFISLWRTFVETQNLYSMCWAPVWYGVGIAWYFKLPVEPSVTVFLFCIVVAAFGAIYSGRTEWSIRPLVLGIALISGGMAIAQFRANSVSAPVLSFRYYGPIEGRIIAIDRSESGATRLTLDQVVLSRFDPRRTPAKVRISLHGTLGLLDPDVGSTVMTTGHLSPPPGPVEPGGFDFQRHAWFGRIGAVGYTRNPLVRLRSYEGSGQMLARFRYDLSRGIQTRMEGDKGAVATAIITGDRSAMGSDVLANLRATNLAHLLAISGLHMGLLTGVVFGALRVFMLLAPVTRFSRNAKKFAAVGALCVGAAYLALSGGNVATIRAFIMVGVVLSAVVLDRRAITLRAVAIAAVIVLSLYPEDLLGPGFQMSFAATVGLVVAFNALRGQLRRFPSWMRPVFAVFISSLVAGLATAPFAAAHFNQISHYGLIANLLCVPIMGVLVMPAAVLSAVLWLFGMESIGLFLMDMGLSWILFVAQNISQWPGAVSHVVAPKPYVLGGIAIGGLLFVLTTGKFRIGAIIIICVAYISWSKTERPELLVSDSGSLIGAMNKEGRALSKPRGDGFAADSWLENDGAPVDQSVAAERPGLFQSGRLVTAVLPNSVIIQVSGRTALDALVGCGGADLLISNQTVEVERPCDVYDISRLRQTGALAIDETSSGLRITTARGVTGERLWNKGAEPLW